MIDRMVSLLFGQLLEQISAVLLCSCWLLQGELQERTALLTYFLLTPEARERLPLGSGIR